MAQTVKIWFGKEVLFSDEAGCMRETEHDAIMERVDDSGRLLGFLITNVSRLALEAPGWIDRRLPSAPEGPRHCRTLHVVAGTSRRVYSIEAGQQGRLVVGGEPALRCNRAAERIRIRC
jgi:hypothetical protein